ncbi:MAG: HAMP domain-containing protein, partial [Zoogloeaceae bacterium]|nr:HAMP domain-containing protein [Zoogloeaceae bacterium]
MKIKTRIYILAISSWVALVLVSLLGWYNATNSNEAFARIDTDIMPKLEAVLSIQVQANNMERRMFETGSKNTFAYGEQIRELKDGLEQKRQADKQAQEWFASYDKVEKHPDIQPTWDQLKALWPAWYEAVGTQVTNSLETAVRNPTPENQDAFYKLVDTTGIAHREASQKITKLLDEVSNETKRIAHDIVKENEAEVHTIQMVQIAVSLLTMVCVVFMGITTLRAVVTPIERVRDTVARVEKENNLQLKVDYQASDEVGEMVHAFNIMMTRLRNSFQDIQNQVNKV